MQRGGRNGGEKAGWGSLSEDPPQPDLLGLAVPPKVCPACPWGDGLCQGLVTNLRDSIVVHGCSWISCTALPAALLHPAGSIPAARNPVGLGLSRVQSEVWAH